MLSALLSRKTHSILLAKKRVRVEANENVPWEGYDGYHVFCALFAMVPRPRVSLCVHFTLVFAHSIRQLPSGFRGD